ncbi:Uncharacterized protein HZ326_30529 [Fusarium oxysporum f. sp. albedinis]|nr:Uncharacterized protein HZ326_30529 [Fusarium oxysporum f. sp. albedinis]
MRLLISYNLSLGLQTLILNLNPEVEVDPIVRTFSFCTYIRTTRLYILYNITMRHTFEMGFLPSQTASSDHLVILCHTPNHTKEPQLRCPVSTFISLLVIWKLLSVYPPPAAFDVVQMPSTPFWRRQDSVALAPPPPGITPNFVDPPTRTPFVISSSIGCFAVSSCFMLIRIYTFVAITKTRDSADYMLVTAWVGLRHHG